MSPVSLFFWPFFIFGHYMGITFFSLVCGPAVIICGGKREKIAYICSTMIACCVLKNKSS